MPGDKKMTQSDASRIQSSQAKSGGDMSGDGFSSRAQSAGDRNANQQAGGGGPPSGGNQAGAQGQQGANK
ncbi:hypothetical protein DL764_008483 [Monosporascus ibericus]|uniref:SMP domain-containing protein n=1 Tax=Monosporascus ibericus TaxID=155417 RepID=A0A4Q4T0E2_9PEZI|nr:hypothetical protein DL764_008483 [Monosporascus ibericus]